MFVAQAHAAISAPADLVWQHLTVGARLAQWFAESDDLGPGAPFRFSFGDGDFFAGRVTQWEPPHLLGLSWRFMGIGPTFDVRLSSAAAGSGTAVTVTDSGAVSPVEAESLRQGWQDFLERLEACVVTGRRTRFTWSDTIGAGAVLRRASHRPRDVVDPVWLREMFGDAQIDARETDGDLSLTFRDPAWNGLTTTARIHTTPLPDAVYLGVLHSGWPALDDERRLDERRRYAGLWQRALVRLETAYA